MKYNWFATAYHMDITRWHAHTNTLTLSQECKNPFHKYKAGASLWCFTSSKVLIKLQLTITVKVFILMSYPTQILNQSIVRKTVEVFQICVKWQFLPEWQKIASETLLDKPTGTVIIDQFVITSAPEDLIKISRPSLRTQLWVTKATVHTAAKLNLH